MRVATLAAAAVLLAAPAAHAGGPKSTPPGQGVAGHEQPAAPSGHVAHGTQTAEGVVQAVSAKAVALKQLDGSNVLVPVDRQTVVFVDGRHTQLAAVKPGFVLDASWVPGKAASVLRFLGPS